MHVYLQHCDESKQRAQQRSVARSQEPTADILDSILNSKVPTIRRWGSRHLVWRPTRRLAIKEESKAIKHNWVNNHVYAICRSISKLYPIFLLRVTMFKNGRLYLISFGIIKPLLVASVYQSSGHTTWNNVDSTSWRWINVETMLFKRCVPAGKRLDKTEPPIFVHLSVFCFQRQRFRCFS